MSGRAPLYPRLLRLRHVHPNAWQRAVLGEGAVAVAGVLVLADLATAWTLLVLPVAVGAVVKSHDLLAGTLAGPDPAGAGVGTAGQDAEPGAGPDSQRPVETDGEPAVGTDREAAVGTDREPAVGTDREPAVGTDGEPAVGTDGEPAAGTDRGPALVTDSGSHIGTDRESAVAAPPESSRGG